MKYVIFDNRGNCSLLNKKHELITVRFPLGMESHKNSSGHEVPGVSKKN